MKIDTTEKWLPLYEALASKVRLRILNILADKDMNIKDLATELNLSSAIITMHIKKLETAGLITSERVYKDGAVQKLCTLSMDSVEIEFPRKNSDIRSYHEFSLPVGHYTDFMVTPTCGLATVESVIGYFDDPRYFMDPQRVNAAILWFTRGYVEYKVPNHLLAGQTPLELEVSLEIGSEAPGVNNNWPSNIMFSINNTSIGTWESPGDFGDKRGIFTPAWWPDSVNQYGMLKRIRINEDGTFIDGTKASDISIKDIDIENKLWSFKVSVCEDSGHVGGATIYGAGFGNYDQDIEFKLYYSNPPTVEAEHGSK